MRERSYLDFDLLVERGDVAGTYEARVVDSPNGQTPPMAFSMPLSDLEIENFLLKVGRPRHGGTRRVGAVGTSEAVDVERFGGALFDAVFQDELLVAYATSLDAAEAAGAGLRLRLRLTDVPELSELPWEYLYDTGRAHFVALSEWTPVVRFLDLPGRVRPLVVEPPLRVLVLVAGPHDAVILDTDDEWGKLRAALDPLVEMGRVQIERVAEGTLAALQQQLRRGDYHVFHFIGHGGYDDSLGDGLLLFEDSEGRGQAVSAQDVGVVLHDHRTLRLAVLNSCEGARSGRADLYSGTAQSLVQQGVPAVVAMQFEITDEAAITFGHSMYEAVADGYPLDAAVAEGRKAVRNQPNQLEWATPVLFLRSPDGQIFDIGAATPPVAAAAPVTAGPAEAAAAPVAAGPVLARSAPARPIMAAATSETHPAATPATQAAPVIPAQTGRLGRRLPLILAGAALLVVLAIVVAVQLSRRDGSPPSTGGLGGATGGNPAGAFALKIGQRVSAGKPAPGAGTLESPGAVDLYAFRARAGQTVMVRGQEPCTVTSFLYWTLVAPDGDKVFENGVTTDCLAHLDPVSLPVDGLYQLRVSSQSGVGTGSYGFTVLNVPAPQQFTVSVGQRVSAGKPAAGAGTLESPGVTDVYAFEGRAGQSVMVRGQAPCTVTSFLYWTIVSPDGDKILDNWVTTDCLGHLDPARLPGDGTYQLRVSSQSGIGTGSYGFALLDVPAPQQFAIAVGQQVSADKPAAGAGTLESPGVSDVYTFEGNAGQLITVRGQEPCTVTGFLSWTLVAPDGDKVFDNWVTTDCASHLDPVRLPKNGTYQLRVTSQSGVSTGSYGFTLRSG